MTIAHMALYEKPEDVHESRCRGGAMQGAVVIGVTLPTLLVCWSAWYSGFPGHVNDMGFVLFGAMLGCGPGAMILGRFLFLSCKRFARPPEANLRRVVLRGVIIGAALAFTNFPGYGVIYLLKHQTKDEFYVMLKVVLLFLVAGASSGAWIAWQAWRAEHAETRFWPQFSLGTLLLAVLAWGALMGVFAPR